MPNIIISGLPPNSKIPKLVFSLKRILKKENIQKFWIRDMSDMRGSNHKQITVDFEDYYDAEKAQRHLDNFKYIVNGMYYTLAAEMDDDVPRLSNSYILDHHHDERRSSHREGRSDRRSYGRYSRERERSRSPYFNEATKLDMEIELLRKQRLVIEEERRLLVERKKLELIKEFGPGSVKDFAYLEDSLEKKRRTPNRGDYRRERSPPPFNPKSQKPFLRHNEIPAFVKPCKILIDKMKPLMSECTRKESKLLTVLIRSTLRKRIAVALENKGYMTSREIIDLYRSLYPVSTDKDLVNKHLTNLKESYVPVTKKRKLEDGQKPDTDNEEVKQKKLDEGNQKKPVNEGQQGNKEDAGTDVKQVAPKVKEEKKCEQTNTEVTENLSKGSEENNQPQQSVEEEAGSAEETKINVNQTLPDIKQENDTKEQKSEPKQQNEHEQTEGLEKQNDGQQNNGNQKQNNDPKQTDDAKKQIDSQTKRNTDVAKTNDAGRKDIDKKNTDEAKTNDAGPKDIDKKNTDETKINDEGPKDINQTVEDKNTEIRNECALSLDATDVDLALSTLEVTKDWFEGGSDWNDERITGELEDRKNDTTN